MGSWQVTSGGGEPFAGTGRGRCCDLEGQECLYGSEEFQRGQTAPRLLLMYVNAGWKCSH